MLSLCSQEVKEHHSQYQLGIMRTGHIPIATLQPFSSFALKRCGSTSPKGSALAMRTAYQGLISQPGGSRCSEHARLRLGVVLSAWICLPQRAWKPLSHSTSVCVGHPSAMVPAYMLRKPPCYHFLSIRPVSIMLDVQITRLPVISQWTEILGDHAVLQCAMFMSSLMISWAWPNTSQVCTHQGKTKWVQRWK